MTSRLVSFPIPVISEILDAPSKAKYFSTIDCASGFLQVLVKYEDQAKTAFSTREGRFQYKRMSFGLNGDPATFQRLMTIVLSYSRNQVPCLPGQCNRVWREPRGT